MVHHTYQQRHLEHQLGHSSLQHCITLKVAFWDVLVKTQMHRVQSAPDPNNCGRIRVSKRCFAFGHRIPFVQMEDAEAVHWSVDMCLRNSKRSNSGNHALRC